MFIHPSIIQFGDGSTRVVFLPIAPGSQVEHPTTGELITSQGPHYAPVPADLMARDEVYEVLSVKPAHRPATREGRTPAEHIAVLEACTRTIRDTCQELPPGPDIAGDRRRLHVLEHHVDFFAANGADAEETKSSIESITGPIGDYDVYDLHTAAIERGKCHHSSDFALATIEAHKAAQEAKLASTRAAKSAEDTRKRKCGQSGPEKGFHVFSCPLSSPALFPVNGVALTDWVDHACAYRAVPMSAIGFMGLAAGLVLHGFELGSGEEVRELSIGAVDATLGRGWRWDTPDTFLAIARAKRATLTSQGPFDASKCLKAGTTLQAWADEHKDTRALPWMKHSLHHIAASAVCVGLDLGPMAAMDFLKEQGCSDDLARTTVARVLNGEFVFHDRGELIPTPEESEIDATMLKHKRDPEWLRVLRGFTSARDTWSTAEVEAEMRARGLIAKGAEMSPNKWKRLTRVMGWLGFTKKRPRDESGKKVSTWVREDSAAAADLVDDTDEG